MKESAHAKWQRLHALRTDLIRRCELYASYTLPYLWTPVDGNPDRDGTAHDWQSIGAQAVNHLVTKLMLTLFSPSRPFLRLDAGDKLKSDAEAQGIKEAELKTLLAESERKAVKKLDQLALRPKLFEALKHIVVFGNVLLILDDKNKIIRVISLKNYVVKRDIAGRLHTLILKETVCFDELTPEAQAATPEADRPKAESPESKVDFYIHIERDGDKFIETQWVGNADLGESFKKTYADESALPYRVLTWNLADEADYGGGLVGDCEGDFGALSTLSEALIEGAILASEYRWLLSPGSSMRPEDFEKTKNGGVIPGVKGDLELINAASAVAASLQVQQQALADYVNRIGRTFLLSSAVTRDAERVTAEEIRLMAQELETGLGGGYSRLGVDIQLPLGVWLIKLTGLTFTKTEAQPTVVTGLDALSRNGDLAAIRAFLADLTQLLALPDAVLIRLKLDDLITDLGTGHGVVGSKYVEKAAAVEKILRERQQNAVAAQAAIQAAQNSTQGAPAQ